MRARGFTLIELMIALAIVAMLAGIVLPIGISRLNADSFIQTQRQVESAVGIARADAQRRGMLMKLIAVEESGVVVLWSVEHAPVERGDKPAHREFVMELPSGATIESAPEVEGDESEAGNHAGGDDGDRADRKSEPAARSEHALCILMPDGTVVPGEPVLLKGRGGAMARIDFNPWTGVLTFTRVEHVEDEQQDASVPAAEAAP